MFRLIQKIVVSSVLVIHLVMMSAASYADHGGGDFRGFSTNSHVSVYLDYNSFVKAGFVDEFPDFTQANMEAAIKLVIDNWVQLSGMRLNVRYAGTGNSAVEIFAWKPIFIQAVSSKYEGALAATGTYGSDSNYASITYFLKDESDNLFDWVVFTDGKKIGFVDVLTHEISHAFGLDHNDGKDKNSVGLNKYRSVVNSYNTFYERFGPYLDDIEDMVAQYGYRDDLKIDVLKTTDYAKTWAPLPSNIESANIQTTLPLNVVRDDDRMLLFYTNREKNPAWMLGSANGDNWDMNSRRFFSDMHSLYGVVGAGFKNEYMMVWVDPTDFNAVKSAISKDGGKTWSWTTQINGWASGTPAVTKLNDNVWAICYPNYLSSSSTFDVGKVTCVTSKNDGVSWGAMTDLYRWNQFRAMRGVTMTSAGSDTIRIAFAMAPFGIDHADVAGATVSINAHFDATKNTLVTDGYDYDKGVRTFNEPSYAFMGHELLLGYRGASSELISRRTSYGELGEWDYKVIVDLDELITSCSVAGRPSTTWGFMFRLKE